MHQILRLQSFLNFLCVTFSPLTAKLHLHYEMTAILHFYSTRKAYSSRMRWCRMNYKICYLLVCMGLIEDNVAFILNNTFELQIDLFHRLWRFSPLNILFEKVQNQNFESLNQPSERELVSHLFHCFTHGIHLDYISFFSLTRRTHYWVFLIRVYPDLTAFDKE